MFAIRHTLIGLVLLLGLTDVSSAQVKDSIDVFTGDRYIHSDSLRAVEVERFEGYDVSMEARYANRYRAGTRWTVSFFAYSARGTSLRDAREMYFVADGERVRPYDTERDIYREQRGRYTILVEKHTGIFKRSAYETLAEANSVRVKVGDAIFALSDRGRRDIADILDRVPRY
jgi:hypothetical protein